ncbi:unnamed protein product [Ilex paraguariensis]|uniref:RRM domain-containing protein n=1 Tax=Ilex paraguariensis TaxID=185542 RepID=A0ABC8SD54_9AQUA
MTMSNINNGQFGDTRLTKVFVGGLAWETPKDAMREHFEKFGDILEAVIISDKFTGRSKGYGFITFKDAEAAKKACEDATPVINGRRANCNLASLGARRPRTSSTTPPQQWSSQNYKIATDVVATDGATNIGPRSTSNGPPTNQVPWYYPVGTPASPFHHQAVPYYGYSPTYVTTDMSYNHITFKDAEAAKKACEDATPVINGRRANCNLASLGARRPRTSSTTPPQQWSSQNYKIATDGSCSLS